MIDTPFDGPVQEIPPDAPPIPHHYLLGKATRIVRYGYAFVHVWYGTHEEMLTWRQNRWQFRPYPSPRPLYQRELLIKHPTAPVLIVDDETAAETASELLPAYVILTWAGGPDRRMENDWSGLQGREVLLWPNAGQYHQDLIDYLALIAKSLRIVDGRDEDMSWNVVAAKERGWSAREIVAWASAHLVRWQDFKPPKRSSPIPQWNELLDEAHWRAIATMGWEACSLDCNTRGVPFATVSNVAKLLRASSNALTFDEFTGRVLCRDKAWTVMDSQDLSVLFQGVLQLPTFDDALVAKGVAWAARRRPIHSLRSWLDRLSWDGTERLTHWLTDVFGVEKDAYVEAVARNWLIGLVARAYEPGCAFPYALVIEGASLTMVSEALRHLAEPWAIVLPNVRIDDPAKLKGAWLAQLPAMASLSARQAEALALTVTAQSDTYRDAKGAAIEDHLRTTLFVATATDDSYGHAPHLWGVHATQVDLCTLDIQRKQLLAEAVVAYRSGRPYTEAPPRIQAPLITEPDSWSPLIMAHVNRVWADYRRTGVRIDLTTARILKDALNIPVSHQELNQKYRVAKILHEQGWVQRRGKSRYWRPVVRRT